MQNHWVEYQKDTRADCSKFHGSIKAEPLLNSAHFLDKDVDEVYTYK